MSAGYILGIDPGTTDSAFAVLRPGTLQPFLFGHQANEAMLAGIHRGVFDDADLFGIEMVASYGMPVGRETFETVLWIGRFMEALVLREKKVHLIYRKTDVCMNLCHTTRAKDTNVRQALIDRFGPVGTKAEPGFFYGVSKHVWSAVAVAVTTYDKYREVKDGTKVTT